MKCPACGRKLRPLTTAKVMLDVCHQGCGGIWFDAQELDRLNQQLPADKEPLGEVWRDETVTVDDEKARKCVRCRGVKLERKLFSLGSGVILDRCPKCQGFWLDHGELEVIRAETQPVPRPVRVVEKPTVRRVPIHFAELHQVRRLVKPA